MLQGLAQWRRHILELFYSGRIGSIEQIEELDQDMETYPLANGEAFGQAHVDIGIGRGVKTIAAGQEVHAVKLTVSIHVGRCGWRRAERETALRAENAADRSAPGELYHAMHQ